MPPIIQTDKIGTSSSPFAAEVVRNSAGNQVPIDPSKPFDTQHTQSPVDPSTGK